jgi:hypothetical protein
LLPTPGALLACLLSQPQIFVDGRGFAVNIARLSLADVGNR